VDERWPTSALPRSDSPDAATAWIDRGAEWLWERLSHSRAAGRLEALVLDVDGSTCSWISGLGSDYQAIAAAARMGHTSGADPLSDMPGGEGIAMSPMTYFAGEESDSTIQPLAAPTSEPPEAIEPAGGVAMIARLKESRGKSAVAAPGRRGVVAACDVPARLFIDALDRQGVEVERAMTLWHALAQAWDPAFASHAGAGESQDAVTAGDAVCAVVLVDQGEVASTDEVDALPPRLVWCWSRGGALLAGGAMRLAHVRSEDSTDIEIGQPEASRLATEWLAWCMQLGVTPRRIVCVLPEVTQDSGCASRFGTALGQAWNDATCDAAIVPDPIASTFERLASILEKSPVTAGAEIVPGAALVDLSTRPGGSHRTMYKWLAGMVLVASVVMGVVAWQAGRSASRVSQAALVWQGKGIEAAKAALGVTPADALGSLRAEVRLRERELVPPSRVVPARPILEEFETITMIIAHDGLTLELLDLSSTTLARFTLTAKDIGTLEEVTKALRQISGSKVNVWDAVYQDFNDPKGGKAVRASYTATWQADPASPQGGP
jgi:hypothetical protein